MTLPSCSMTQANLFPITSAIGHLQDLEVPIHTVACIDNCALAAETHLRNHGEIHLTSQQIPSVADSLELGHRIYWRQDVTTRALALLRGHTRANMWTVSCPCPPWSRAGGEPGFESESGRLWLEVFEAAHLCKPIMIVAEKVTTITEHQDVRRIKDLAAWAGYRFLWEDMLHFKTLLL